MITIKSENVKTSMNSKNKTLKHFLVGLLLLASFSSHAQIEEVLERLNLFSLAYPQEKVYLHTDRSTYGTGETIWFQSYTTISPLGTFTDLSNTLYVQLLDPEGKEIVQIKSFLEEGVGHGHIELPLDLAGGTYQIVAFTNWMQNFGQETFFRKNIDLITKETASNAIDQNASNTEIDLQFFPESGSLIENIPTKVAFKSINQDGLPINVRGNIYDSNDSLVQSFISSHNGMGTLLLTPLVGENYYAKVEGRSTKFDLPSIKTTGAHLRVNQLNDQLKLSIYQSNTAKEGFYHLLIHSEGFISSALQIPAGQELSILNLPFEKLDFGINSLTLFNEKSEPVAERLVFIHKDYVNTTANLENDIINTRSRASIDVQFDLPDTSSAFISMSAVDITQTFEETKTENILSELLLSSELSGHIQNPAYYFTDITEQKIKELDFVMLTHGWRTFAIDQIAGGNFPAIEFIPEKGVTIAGKSFKKGNKERVAKNAKLTLIRQHDELPVILETSADKEGNFVFPEAIIFEDDSLLIRGSREKNGKSNLRLVFDTTVQTFDTKYLELIESMTYTPIDEESFISMNEERKQIDAAYGFLLDSTATLLDDAIVEGYRTRERLPDSVLYRTQIGRGDAAEDFNDPMYQGAYSNIFVALTGKVPGLEISNGGSVVRIRQAGRTTQSEPLYLLNDVPVDRTFIETFTVQQLERVVVFKSLAKTAIYGSEAAGGIVAFYTREGEEGQRASKAKPKISISQFTGGYQAYKTFYSPKYDVQLPEHIIPDRRVLLHWQPDIRVDGNELKNLEFWSSDLEGIIGIEIQGLTTEGKPIYIYKTIEVTTEN